MISPIFDYAASGKWPHPFAAKHWTLLTRWAEYLREKGLDPENQLCTDDFTGHLAHNANLSLKAINALGAYGMLCDMLGKKDDAAVYRSIAQDMARKWVQMADDPDHYRLTFDGLLFQQAESIWTPLGPSRRFHEVGLACVVGKPG